MKKKKLDIFTIPENELRDYLYRTGWNTSLVNGEIKLVELTDHGIEFTFFKNEVWKKFQETSPAELKARGEAALNAIEARYRSGEIDALERSRLEDQEPHSSGITVFILDEDFMLYSIHNMRFPSFWGSFFKIESWAEPVFGKKITKVELTNDGIEFTIEQLRYP